MTIKTTDWAAVIDQLLRRNVTMRQIGEAMQMMLTTRMIRHYSIGVQPAHFRGEALIAMWCDKTGKSRDNLPTCDLVRGHRVERNREPDASPRLQELPQWPAAAPVAVKPVKRGRPRKVSNG